MFKKLSPWIATYFGVGLLKGPQGTWATILSVPLYLLMAKMSPVLYMLSVLVLLIVGILASQVYEAEKGEHDVPQIVIDEVVGFLITMTWLPCTWQSVVAGVVLFRFFDILKPFPISYIDQKVQGGLGVMLDDVAAGLAGNIILQIVLAQTAWLGTQVITVGS